MDLGELGNRKKQPVGRTLVEIRNILQRWDRYQLAEQDSSSNARENAERLRYQHENAKARHTNNNNRFLSINQQNHQDRQQTDRQQGDLKEKSSWLWPGLAAAGLAGFFTMIPEDVKAQVLKPILETTKSFVNNLLEFSKEKVFEYGQKAIELALENPLETIGIGSAVVTTMFPGVVGKAITSVGKVAFSNPVTMLATLAVGGLVYNVYKTYQDYKENGGSFGDIIKELLIGKEGGIGNALGKAGTYAVIGATVGSIVPGLGTMVGFLGGAAIGAIIGSLGLDGIEKYILNTHQVVAEWMGWKTGSLAYKLAEQGKYIPYVGPLMFGLVGSMIPDNALTRGVLETTGIIEEGSITEYSSDQDKHKDEKSVNNLKKTSWWKNLPAKKREEYESEPSEYKRNKKIQADFENHTRQRVYSRAQELQDEFGGPNENIPITSQNAQLPKPSNFSNVSYNDLNFGEKLIADSVKSIFSIGSAASATLGLGGSGLMTSSGWSNSSNSSLGGYTPIDISTLSDELGSLSASQESNNDPRTIGYDSKGGTSYGTYQLASAQGTPKTFLEYVRKNGGEYGKEIYDTMYRACGGNWSRLNTGSKSGTPVDAWRAIASKDPIAFHKLEHDFFVQEYYGKAFKQLNPEVQEIVKKNRALQEALFSTSVQHGHGKGAKIVNDAYQSGMQIPDFISKIYQLRAERYNGDYRNAVMNRYKRERDMVLSLYYKDAGIDPKTAQGNYDFTIADNGNYGQPSGSYIQKHGLWANYPNVSPQDLEMWKIDPSQSKLVWPAESNVVTSPAGPRNAGSHASRFHGGIDIRAGKNDPIMAAMGGTVTAANPRKLGFVEIQHPGGWKTRYMHMNKINVQPGQMVNPGDTIGGAGNIDESGNPSPHYVPHLHFEMIKGDRRADPEGVFYQYNKSGGQTPYNGTYSGVGKNREFTKKLASAYGKSGGNAEAGGPTDDKWMSIQKTTAQGMDLQNQNQSTSIEDMVAEVRTLTAVIAKTNSTPNIVPVPVATPAVSDGGGVGSGGSTRLGDSSIDSTIDKMFQQIGSIVNKLNISHVNLDVVTV